MTTTTTTTTRTAWCPRCRCETAHVFAELHEPGADYHLDQCLECGRWAA